MARKYNVNRHPNEVETNFFTWKAGPLDRVKCMTVLTEFGVEQHKAFMVAAQKEGLDLTTAEAVALRRLMTEANIPVSSYKL